ncbi:RDD family protein [Paludibaculum fermentans]|uniref:RDD family protein n=1 Tax=Paludibaculum fermentans TaxID=1473598 RepID=A0A7S7NUV0_PALFE|nr:RDD family protein [Paludibaculum fermentans]QOY90241.1 RDD family protein [Paludibaculum fermentans]
MRCAKCQRRMDEGNGYYPIVDGAAAPELEYYPETVPAEAPQRLTTVHSNPTVARTGGRPVQPPLFPYREPRKVVGLEDYSAGQPAAPRQRTGTTQRTVARKQSAGQTAFDFESPAPPSKPFSREMNRRTDYPVAPVSLRGMAALFDAGLVLGMMGLFLLTVRLSLGMIPTGTAFYFCYGFATILIAGVYKLLFCMFGQVTLGLQGAHLQVVSFDGHRPTVTQRFVRMFSGWISLASVGMGVLWSLADRESLTWHDHISQTFLTHYDPEGEDEVEIAGQYR